MMAREIGWRDPCEAFGVFAGEPHAHLLHGGERSGTAEWSIIAAFPETVLAFGAAETGRAPFRELQAAIDRRSQEATPAINELPFVSGVIGYVGYETARFIEPALSLPASPYGLPDITFGVYDAAALFSRQKRKAYIAGRNKNARDRLAAAFERDASSQPPLPAFGALRSNFTPAEYEASVRAAIEEILDGDYYQANLSHQIGVEAGDAFSPYVLFQELVRNSDAYFGALLQYPHGAIVSNSPERFFRVEPIDKGKRRIIPEPIKGTRPRGETEATDKALIEELLSDPKDRAENVMIADLMRNDLSKICDDASIKEEAICELMSLASVHHLVSRIGGVLRSETNFEDVFAALFPCGSITGAPKIEAMNAIARQERIGRGPYCGAIGYIDDRGTADFSVAIRTIMCSKNSRRLTIPVGGGVTLKSDPHQEYLETLAKARAALDAIGKSSRELL